MGWRLSVTEVCLWEFYVCTNSHIHTHIHILYIHIHAHTRTCSYKRTLLCGWGGTMASFYKWTPVSVSVTMSVSMSESESVFLSMHVRVSVCVCVCLHVSVCVCMCLYLRLHLSKQACSMHTCTPIHPQLHLHTHAQSSFNIYLRYIHLFVRPPPTLDFFLFF